MSTKNNLHEILQEKNSSQVSRRDVTLHRESDLLNRTRGRD